MRLRYRKHRCLRILLLLVLFISIGTGFVFRRLETPFDTAFAAYAAEAGNSAVNEAIEECLDDISYTDLIILNKNTDGNIVSMTANGIKISILKAKLAESIEQYILNLPENSISLNYGAAQNNVLLSACGPRIKIKLSPNAITKTEFRDEFMSAGINHVRHCIYLDVTLSVTVTSFNMQKNHIVSNSILVTDTVITGEVPNLYGGCISQLNNTRE